MIAVAAVLRDLRRGAGVRNSEAPEAAAELVASGVVEVRRGGWLRLVGVVHGDDVARRRHRPVVEPFAAAHERRERVVARLRIGPATARDLARVGNVGVDRARQLARASGAVLQYAEDEHGRPAPYWRMP